MWRIFLSPLSICGCTRKNPGEFSRAPVPGWLQTAGLDIPLSSNSMQALSIFFCGNLIQNCEALGTKSQCSLVVRHVSLPLRQEQRRCAASRRRLVCGSLARQAACAVQRCARWVFHLADADPGTAEQHSVYRWELVWSPRHEAKWWNDACHGCSKSICKELLVSGSSAEHRLVLQKPLSLTAVTRLYIVWQYLPRIIPKYIVTLDVLFI